MNAKYENCDMVDLADLAWCATDVNSDGSFNSFEFCDGQCSTAHYDPAKITDRSVQGTY